jgi:hypothetical protein
MIRIALSLVLMGMVMGKGAAETRTLKYTDFEEVGVASGMRASIKQGNTYQVTATGSSEDLKRLQVRQSGKRLEFSMPPNFQFRSTPISLNITMPALLGLDLSGGSDGNFTMDIGSRPFRAELSGGSELRGQIRSRDIKLILSGGSRATLSGSGQRLSLDGSGGSQFELGALEVTELSGSLSGGSEAVYHKNAKLGSVDKSGGSELRKGR